ncbi:MAG: MFS transporter [Sphingomonadales bacterium]|jgi:MFS family permease
MAQTGAQSRAVTALVWLIGLAVFINYVDRGTLGIAAPQLKADLGLTATQYGLAASAFFWVYAPGQLVAGWLVGRRPAGWLMAAGLGLWGLATALTGLATGLAALVALRLLLGLGESITFPALFKLIVDHVDSARQGAANAALSMGLALGPAFGTLAGGLLLAELGWRWLFAIVGIATLLWLLPWRLTLKRLPPPADHGAPAGHDGPNYLAILATRAVLSLSLVQVCWGFGLYFLVTWLPLWLVDVRHYSLAGMAWIGSLAFVAQAVAALIAGQGIDQLLRRGLAPGAVRRGGAMLGALCLSLGLAAIPLSTGQPALIAALLLAGFGIGMMHVCVNMAAQMFAGPAAVGKWTGIQNGFGNIAGVVNPLVTGVIVDATGSYDSAFWLAAGLPLIGLFSLAVLVPRIAPIDWDQR